MNYSDWITIAITGALVLSVVINSAPVRYFMQQLKTQGEIHKAERDAIEARRLLAEDRLKLQEEKFTEYHRYKEESRAEFTKTIDAIKNSSGLDQLEHINRLAGEGEKAIGAADILLDLYHKDDCKASTKWHILSCLAKISKSAAIHAVVEALDDDHPSVKAYAAYMAGQLSIADAIGKLHDLLFRLSEYDCVKSYAQWALMELKQEIDKTVLEKHSIFAYILVKGPKSLQPNNFNNLRDLAAKEDSGIMEAGIVYGDYDVLLKLIVPDKDVLDRFVLKDIQALPWVEHTRTFFVASEPRYFLWIRRGWMAKKNKDGGNISWILVRAPAPQSGGVVVCAEDIPEIVEAATVFGEADVVLKINAKEKKLGEVMTQMRKIPYTTNTQTYTLMTHRYSFYFGPEMGLKLPQQLLI